MNKTRLQKFGFDKTLIRFIIVGGCCTLIDFAIYMLIMEHVGAVIGKAVSMGCSMLVNFFLNKFWSFSAGGTADKSELPKYICTQIVNISINVSVNAGILYVLNRKVVAFVGATGMAMIVNYLLQKFWVFKKDKCSV